MMYVRTRWPIDGGGEVSGGAAESVENFLIFKNFISFWFLIS